MAHRDTLTEKQLDVLRWIGDGCPDGRMHGDFHKISAAALKRRGLVKVAGHGAGWRASITDAGREYVKQADGPDAPKPRQANVSVTQQLVDDVIAAGGSLRVPRKHWGEQGAIDYENRARLAERHGKVPDGKVLDVKAVSRDESQIDLVDPFGGTDVVAQAVPVPERVARYHRVVQDFKKHSERHEVSRAALPRAMRILQALVVEAERRGHAVVLAPAGDPDGYGRRDWNGSKHGHIVIDGNGCATAIRISEAGLTSRAAWVKKNRTFDYIPGARAASASRRFATTKPVLLARCA